MRDLNFFEMSPGQKCLRACDGRANRLSTYKHCTVGLSYLSLVGNASFRLSSSVKIFADDLKIFAYDKTVIDNNLKSLEDWERN